VNFASIIHKSNRKYLALAGAAGVGSVLLSLFFSKRKEAITLKKAATQEALTRQASTIITELQRTQEDFPNLFETDKNSVKSLEKCDSFTQTDFDSQPQTTTNQSRDFYSFDSSVDMLEFKPRREKLRDADSLDSFDDRLDIPETIPENEVLPITAYNSTDNLAITEEEKLVERCIEEACRELELENKQELFRLELEKQKIEVVTPISSPRLNTTEPQSSSTPNVGQQEGQGDSTKMSISGYLEDSFSGDGVEMNKNGMNYSKNSSMSNLLSFN